MRGNTGKSEPVVIYLPRGKGENERCITTCIPQYPPGIKMESNGSGSPDMILISYYTVDINEMVTRSPWDQEK